MGVDSSEVDQLAFDLSRAPERMKRGTARTMKRSALEIKRGMQREFSGHRYAGAVPLSIEFQWQGGNRYEIGELDSAGPQWGLAAILSYGTSNNAPVADHRAPLRREAPAMLHHLLDAAEDSVFGAAK